MQVCREILFEYVLLARPHVAEEDKSPWIQRRPTSKNGPTDAFRREWNLKSQRPLNSRPAKLKDF